MSRAPNLHGRRETKLFSKIITNAMNQTCQHLPSWIFQMLRCILWSEMSFLVGQTLHFKARNTLPFDAAVGCFFLTIFFLMVPNILTLENLGARWLLAKKVNFMPCISLVLWTSQMSFLSVRGTTVFFVYSCSIGLTSDSFLFSLSLWNGRNLIQCLHWSVKVNF